MVAGESSDLLPPGWQEHIKFSGGKKIKYYTNAATGKKFYSKKGVVSYVNMTNDNNSTPQPQSTNGKEGSPQSTNGKEGSESKAQSGGAQTNESPAWLPPGWIMEVKPRKSGLQNNSTYKIYIDPSTGSKFYSKPEVSRYLESLDQSKSEDQRTKNTTAAKSPLKQDVSAHKKLSQGHSGTSKKEKNGSSKPSTEIVRADVVESSSLDKLSVGWIVEFKTLRYGHGIKIEPYYTDPVSGYVFCSERDVLRYLETGDISQCAIRSKKRDENNSESTKDVNSNTPMEKSFFKKDVPEHLVLTKGEISKSEKKRNSISKQSTDVVEITSEDGLPPGWIKEIKTRRNANGIRRDPYYTDPVSGYMFRSKKDVLRYIETGDINKCVMKPKKRDDPVSTKENDPEPTKDVTFPSPPVGKRYSLRSSKGQLSGGEELNDGKENCDMSSSPVLKVASSKRKKVNSRPAHAVVTESPALEAESSKRKKANSVSADAVGTESVTEVPGKMQPYRRGRKSRKTAQRSEPESQGSQQDNIVSADNRAVYNAGTDNNLHGQKFPKNTKKQKISRNTPMGSKTSKKRIAQSVPGRTSKRLAGSEPEMPANLQLSERSLRAAIKKSCEGEEDILSIITMNGVPSGVPQQLDFERSSETVVQRSLGFEQSSETAVQRSLDAELASETAVRRSDEDGRYVSPITTMNTVAEGIHQPLDPEPALGVADIVSMVVESASKIESSEKSEEPSAQNQAVPQEKTGGQVRERQDFENPKTQNPQGTYQFLDSWTDPCLDFAFKTLTGAISVDDKLGYQGSSQNRTDTTSYIQRNEYFGQSQNRTDTTSYIQRNEYFGQSQNPTDNTTYIQRNENYGQSGSQRLSTFQNGTPSLSLNLGEQHVQVEQFPRAPPSPPPGFALPLFRGLGSQQRSSDARSEYQRNTNYK